MLFDRTDRDIFYTFSNSSDWLVARCQDWTFSWPFFTLFLSLFPCTLESHTKNALEEKLSIIVRCYPHLKHAFRRDYRNTTDAEVMERVAAGFCVWPFGTGVKTLGFDMIPFHVVRVKHTEPLTLHADIRSWEAPQISSQIVKIILWVQFEARKGRWHGG